MIRRKPELYCVPLKRAPVKGGGPENEGEGLILQSMPAKDMQYLIEGQTIPWYEADVHWYIVGGQHTYQACVNIAKKEVPGSAKHKFYTKFNVIPVYSRKVIFIKMRQTEVSFLKIPKFRMECYPL